MIEWHNMEFPGPSSIKLDDKSRLALPVRYRNELKKEWGTTLIMTLDIHDPILLIYPLRYWTDTIFPTWNTSQLDAIARQAKRRFIGNATESAMDAQGRIRIPPPLKQAVHIDNEVVMRRIGQYFELNAPEVDVAAPLSKEQPLPSSLEGVLC